MALEELRLSLTSETSNWDYIVTNIQESGDDQSKEAFSISPPGQGAANNILLGISGMQKNIELRFQIHDDGTDKSDGTVAQAVADGDIAAGVFTNDTVVTLEEQVRWLEDYLHRPTFSATWELDHITGSMYQSDPVFMERIDTPTIVRDSPKWLPARIQLRVGTSVG